MAKLTVKLRRLVEKAARLPKSQAALADVLERIVGDEVCRLALTSRLPELEEAELHQSLEGCAALLRELEKSLDAPATADKKKSKTEAPAATRSTTEPQLPDGVAPKMVHVFIDGGSRGNPGPAACGVVFCDENDRPFWQTNRRLGRTTNNVAEYQGLITAIELALEHGWRRLRVFADSELLVRQMTGVYRVKNPGLQPLARQASGLIRQCEYFKISHVRREKNTLADAMANKALDGK